MSTARNKDAKIPELIARALEAAASKQAEDVVLLDLRKVATFTDHFVLLSGSNQKQLVAIVDAILDALRKSHKRPEHVEGYPRQEWMLLDFGAFIVHVFTTRMRKYYDLERLWGGAKRMEVAV
jgi:ribosome-associated protein